MGLNDPTQTLVAPKAKGIIDPNTGKPRKLAFGPWMFTALKWLAKGRWLRGTRWDVFGRSEERRRERALLADYEADIAAVLGKLEHGMLDAAVALAALPEEIRGFGHVRRRSIDGVAAERAALRAKLGID